MDAIRNNKKLRAIVIAVGVVLLLLALNAVANRVSYPYVKAKAVTYLSHKYDAKRSEFELVDYRHAGTYWDSSRDEFFQFLAWRDFAFEFEYKGREFFVNRSDGKFYDDYQLEDVEIWCTQWLQENVDSRITGIDISSRELLYYAINSERGIDYIITKDDTEEFLNTYSFIDNDNDNENGFPLYVFFYDDSINISNKLENQEGMNGILNAHLNLDSRVSSEYSSTPVTKQELKSDWYEWVFQIRT